VTEGFARVYELLTSFIAMSGARALDGGLGASVLHLLSFVPNDLVIRFCSVSGKAGPALAEFSAVCRANKFCPGQVRRGQMIRVAKGGKTKTKPGKLTSAIGLSRS
jgi:hypothetical protein